MSDSRQLAERLAGIVRLGEVELKEPMPTWVSRVRAVLAECFSDVDSAFVVAMCSSVVVSDWPNDSQEKWQQAAGVTLTQTLIDAWGNDGARVASARKWLTRLAEVADRKSGIRTRRRF